MVWFSFLYGVIYKSIGDSFFLILKTINVLTKEQFEEFAELFFNPVSTELSIKFLIDLVKDKEFKFYGDRLKLVTFKDFPNLNTSFYFESGKPPFTENRLVFSTGNPWDRRLEVKYGDKYDDRYFKEFSDFMENKYYEYKKAKERES